VDQTSHLNPSKATRRLVTCESGGCEREFLSLSTPLTAPWLTGVPRASSFVSPRNDAVGPGGVVGVGLAECLGPSHKPSSSLQARLAANAAQTIKLG
jgi:hypothetical protein